MYTTLSVWGTRNKKDVVSFLQTDFDKKTDFYTKRSENSGGGGKIEDMIADIANEIIGRYYLNKVKNFEQIEGEVLNGSLDFFKGAFGIPYFIGSTDVRFNHLSVHHLENVKITQKNLLKIFSKEEIEKFAW